jgi:hypothetical protein
MVVELDKSLTGLRITVLLRDSGVRLVLLEPQGVNIVERIVYRDHVLIPYTSLDVTIREPEVGGLDFFRDGDILLLEARKYNLDGTFQDEIINQFYIGEINYTDNPLNMVTFICRDLMFFATSSEFSETLDLNETASDFIRRIAEKYNFPIDDIEDTETKLESHLFDNATLYSMWLAAITLEMNRTKQVYRLYMKHNGLVLESFKTRQNGWVFEAQSRNGNIVVTDRKVSVFNDKFNNSILSYVPSNQNQDDIVGSISALTSPSKTILLEDAESINKYGLFQKRINVGNLTAADAQLSAETMFQPIPLDDISLTTLPFFGIKGYDIIYLINTRIHVASQYFVNTLELNIDSGAGSMKLSLSKIRDIPKEVISTITSSGILSGISS